jgi:hypothetical protein
MTDEGIINIKVDNQKKLTPFTKKRGWIKIKKIKRNPTNRLSSPTNGLKLKKSQSLKNIKEPNTGVAFKCGTF